MKQMVFLIKIPFFMIIFLIPIISTLSDAKPTEEKIGEIKELTTVFEAHYANDQNIVIYGLFKGDEIIVNYNPILKTSKTLIRLINEKIHRVNYIAAKKSIFLNTFETYNNLKESLKVVELDLDGEIKNILPHALIIQNDAFLNEAKKIPRLFILRPQTEMKMIYNILEQYDITTSSPKFINRLDIFKKHNLLPKRIYAHPDNEFIYALCSKKNEEENNYDGLIYKVNLKDNSLKLIKTIPSLLKGGLYSFSPNGEYFAFSGPREQLKVIQTSTGKTKDIIKLKKHASVLKFDWSYDERKIAYIFLDFKEEETSQVLCIYDVMKEQHIASIRGSKISSPPLTFCWAGSHKLFYFSLKFHDKKYSLPFGVWEVTF